MLRLMSPADLNNLDDITAVDFNRVDDGHFMHFLPKVAAHQPHSRARINHYRCFLPDLTGFAIYRREGTNEHTIDKNNTGIISVSAAIRPQLSQEINGLTHLRKYLIYSNLILLRTSRYLCMSQRSPISLVF